MTAQSPEQFSMRDQSSQTESDRQVALDMEAYFDQGLGTNIDKLQNFPKFVTRQRVVGVHGHVLECEVFLGGGLMTWAQLSAIYEPYNHVRRIIGFDTFAGFRQLHAKDQGRNVSYAVECGLANYLVVFDTVIEDVPPGFFPGRPWDRGNNPKTAVWEFLKTTDRFSVDRDIENKLLITVAPDGYLKCVKD